jgi:hypothetical protein
MDRNEYMRLYYLSHPEYAERRRQQQREWRAANRDAHRAYTRKWKAEHPDRKAPYDPEKQRQRVPAKYGVDYDAMLKAQGGVCALCGQPERVAHVKHLSVDHDHTTGRVRGLLCVGCNISLGYYERGYRSKLDIARVREYLS